MNSLATAKISYTITYSTVYLAQYQDRKTSIIQRLIYLTDQETDEFNKMLVPI